MTRYRHYQPPPPGEGPPPDLFDPPTPPPPPEHDGRARHTDPDTSHQAARKARTGRIDLLILCALAESIARLAYWQLAHVTGEREVVISPRLKQIEKMGYLRRVVKEINPKTGRECWTCEITERGRVVVETQGRRSA